MFIEWVNFCPRQEPWELALLTQTWYTKLANIKLPFLEEIAFGSCVHLKKCKTIKDGLLPSAECKFCRTYFNKLQIVCVILIIGHVFESAHSHPGSLLCSSVFLFGIQECGFFCVINIHLGLNYAWWKMSVGLLRVFYFSAIQCEREYEMKRLNNLKCQENAAKKIQFSLREGPVGLRRPLPPKWLSSHSWICSLWGLHPKRMKDSDLSLCAVGCIHLNAPWWMNQLLWVMDSS